MKTGRFAFILLMAVLLSTSLVNGQASHLVKNSDGKGSKFEIELLKGDEHNYPSFSIWLEDQDGKYIQTLFVTQYVGTGTYRYGELEKGKWKDEFGEAERPATLPYWLHKRNIITKKGSLLPSKDEPVPDAYTSATPQTDFILETKSEKKLPQQFRIMLEVNQPWDSNKYWTNAKDPDNWDYSTSLQPALIYSADIDLSKDSEYELHLVGHSHWAGENGEMYKDLSTISTAKEIFKQIRVRVK